MNNAQENYKGVWDTRIGFGKKTALIVIDLVQAYITEGSPLFAPGVVKAVAETKELLDQARQRELLTFHTNVKYNKANFVDGGMWVRKAPVLRCFVDNPNYGCFAAGLEPIESEIVVTKQYASAFFGTSLAASLTASSVDTVILVGCTTSGCIRASAVDAVQHGFRTIVVEECVGDRHEAPHVANLFDINSKYGDVVSKQQALDHLRS